MKLFLKLAAAVRESFKPDQFTDGPQTEGKDDHDHTSKVHHNQFIDGTWRHGRIARARRLLRRHELSPNQDPARMHAGDD